MIRIGPAAAPRWFDQDPDRFEEYLDLLEQSGASAIEFVVLPGPGSEELGRVHILEPNWYRLVNAAQRRSFTVNLHAPLPGVYRLAEWKIDPAGYGRLLESTIELLNYIGAHQMTLPVLVMHADSDDPELTGAILGALLNSGGKWSIVLELRAPQEADDQGFDRKLDSLAAFVAEMRNSRVGICWDIAHDWERTGSISRPTDDQLSLIRHVHLHDNRPDGHVHAPLGLGSIPWRTPLTDLARRGWQGSITLEIRYRYASEIGEPWSVLSASLAAVRDVLGGSEHN